MTVLFSFVCAIIVVALVQLQVSAFLPFSKPFSLHHMKQHPSHGIQESRVNHRGISLLKKQNTIIALDAATFGADDDDDYDEDEDDEDSYAYLKESFIRLSKNSGSLDMNTFVKWDEIQQLVEDKLLTMEEVRNTWLNHATATETIDEEKFILMNEDLDELIEDKEENDDENMGEEYDDEVFKDARIPLRQAISSSQLKELADTIEPTVWYPGLKPETLFEGDFRDYLIASYEKLTKQTNAVLYFKDFSQWEDVARLMADGNLDVQILHTVWKEAIEYQYREEELQGRSFLEMPVDLDTFYRLSYRLDDMMDELQQALKDLTDKDVEEFYRTEFQALTGGGLYLTYNTLLLWPFLQETFEMNPDSFTADDLKEIWDAIPKKLNDYGEKCIDESDFLVLNEAIDDLVMSFDIPASPEFADNNILQ